MKRKAEKTLDVEEILEDVDDEEMDDLEEEDQDDQKGSKKNVKHAVKATAAAGALLKPVKMSKAELYKPPTNEELNQLKETENLFHSNLLRMQIEELLNEVKLKEKKRKTIDAFLHEINTLLSNVPKTQETDIADQSWLAKDVKVPFLQVPYGVKGKFHFLPPVSVKVVGSYLLGTCILPGINVDVAVTMPQEILQAKDNLNQRYHRKRALYLAHIAQHFSKQKLFGSVKFAYMNGNHMKPVLILQPQGKDEKLVTVRLHVCPPPGFFKSSRLHPTKNNVRTAWFLEKGPPQQGTIEPPTPHYNNAVLSDTVLEQHLHYLASASTDFPGMKDGISILKVWLHQRELDKGFGSFNGFAASMLVLYLLSKHKINKLMSGYQVLRNVLQFLATADLTVNGISLSKSSDVSLPALADFHQAFEVVFVDPSGFVNLCADMTESKYKQLQFEAKQSMEVLDDTTADGFHLLLMVPKPLLETFDHVFHLRNVAKLQGACKKMKLINELMDHSGNYVAAALPFLLSLIQRGLGDRLVLLSHALPQTPEWSIAEDPPKHKDIDLLSFGLILRPEYYNSVLEKGPEADSPKAVEFQRFWGERSELRRFQDGSVCEAVVWAATTIHEKRLIPEQIVKHLLHLHAEIPVSSLCYVAAPLESVIKVGKELSGTGEEQIINTVKSYDDLSRNLWSLDGLPLTVTSVQGTHSVLRYTDVFPPVPVKPDYEFHQQVKQRNSLIPLLEKPCPAYVAPLKVICHMEGSGKWPQDKEAIKRVKAAFHIRLGELLKEQHRLICRATATHTDVYKDGFVFRIQVAYHREPHFMKELVTPDGMLKYRDTEESRKLEMETLHLPYLTSTVHGLQQQHPAFSSTSRLVKRWISAQLLSDSISDESMDLLVAFLFLHPAPFTPPSSPQVGFIRFLRLLTTFDWKNEPLIVNLNQDIKDVEYAEIRNYFIAARAHLPVMFICTPKDRKESVWTKEKPTAQILQRLIVLSIDSVYALTKQLMDPLGEHDMKLIFRPPLDCYDVLIHLNPKQIPRHREAVDKPVKSFFRGMLNSDAPVKTFFLPVVDYDPVQLYLSELRAAFKELALFFYDKYGGEVIGVLWNPSGFAPQSFKTTNAKARMMEVRGTESVMVPNVEAILEDFEILGQGLVSKVEARTEKWNI
ncbi:nucleolar protein 6 [Ambystoma mexicanum]|uniref:nucleolar protein 6 n=1 Tax=Ambystoma mexicanum TaxID=8296 RepID=UPI0037E93130